MSTPIHERPVELLQRLIQFDTTNPPGNEAECAAYIRGLLQAAGIETTVIETGPNRANVVARLRGAGRAPALLLYGHMDVVTTEHQPWTKPPFGGEVADGFVWGRGALDMKGPLTMLLAAFLKAKAENVPLAGDVVFAAVADEEHSGNFGTKYLVERRPELFAGVRYALGEFGGFNLNVAGQAFYAIMVSEKQFCSLRVTVRGAAGHGSMPLRGGAMAKLGRVLRRLDENPLPVNISPATRMMVEGMARHMSPPVALVLRQLLNPALSNYVLGMLGPAGKAFNALVRNTVSPTIVHGGDKINVIPAEVAVELDGRMVPGFKAEDFVAEVQAVVGADAEVAVTSYDPGPAAPDMGWFDTLGEILTESDPGSHAMPLVLPGVTDARFLTQLGIQTYGFTPMHLPPDLDFTASIHSADERIPVEALAFGTQAVFKALQRMEGKA
jgi:acetylornithine deacetylase/succinyl-diaminopimelate desuccinylase-like protein